MALTKRLYKNHQTVITGENLNDIQDAIIALEKAIGIVPGEGEITKIINVLNADGTLTAAEAATLPDGLYWLAQPVTFESADQTQTFMISGLCEKAGESWHNYAIGKRGTVDSAGDLVSVESTIVTSAVAVSAAMDTYTVTFADGTTVEGVVSFDASGLPTSLADDQGNTVAFDGLGNPTTVTTSSGDTVNIY